MLVLKRKIGQRVHFQRYWRDPATAVERVACVVLVRGAECSTWGWRVGDDWLVANETLTPSTDVAGWQPFPGAEERITATLCEIPSVTTARIGFVAPAAYGVWREEITNYVPNSKQGGN